MANSWLNYGLTMKWLYGKFYSWLTIFSTKSKIIHLSQAYAGYNFLKLWMTETFRVNVLKNTSSSYTENMTENMILTS